MQFILDEKEFFLRDKIQVLYFYAPWMPQHKKIVSMLSKMEDIYQFEFIAIDVDYFKPFCKRFNITSIPEIIILDNGKELKRISGVILFSAMKNAFINLKKGD